MNNLKIKFWNIIVDKIWPRYLWQQVFFVLIFLVICPLGVMGLVMLHSSKQTIEQTIHQDSQEIVRQASLRAVSDVEAVVSGLQATASILGVLNMDQWQQETVVVQLALKYPMLRNVCLYNLNGEPQACSHFYPTKLPSLENVFSCLSHQSYCLSTIREQMDHIPVMDITVPLFHSRNILGFVRAEYSLRGMWNTIDHMKVGQGSKAMVVDLRGRYLVHPDKKLVLTNAFFKDKKILDDIQEGESGSRIMVDENRDRWLAAYAPLKGFTWGLIVCQPYDRAFHLSSLMTYGGVGLLLMTLFLVSMVGFIIIRRVNGMMREIVLVSQQIAKGNLDTKLPINRRDDINRVKVALNHMTQKLKHLNELERLSIVGRFASSIAHELKNSMTLIRTLVQMIPQRSSEKAFVNEATETIIREMNHWNEMLKSIMDFAMQKTKIELKALCISRLVEETMLLMKLRAQDMQVQLEVQIPKTELWIKGDANKLQQVLVNLVNNAFDAVKEDARIYVKCYEKNQQDRFWVIVDVFNSGEAIGEAQKEKVFEYFHTTKENGLGLGLAISREIVLLHNGRIEVEAIKDQGTVFRIILPKYMFSILEGMTYDSRENSHHRR